MPKFKITIELDSDSAEHANKVAKVLQNMVDNTNPEIQRLLFEKVSKVPQFFKSLLQNPFVKNFIK